VIKGDFVVHCLVAAVLWSIFHPSCSSEAVMRLDYQILLKSPPLTLLAGSATAVAHIVSACSEIAGSLYKARHNNVAAAIHHSICQNYEIKMTDNIWLHKPNSVAEKNIVKVLWDFEIRTNRQIQARIPDLVVIDKQTKERLVIDVAIPNDTHIVDKEREKIETRAWG